MLTPISTLSATTNWFGDLRRLTLTTCFGRIIHRSVLSFEEVPSMMRPDTDRNCCTVTKTGNFGSAELLYGYEDWEFWVRLSSKGHYGISVRAPVFEHRRHGITMTHRANEQNSFLHSQIVGINTKCYQPETITTTKETWRPLISVIIPFYNSPRYLKETLASLEAQTSQDFETILVNDGSDDPVSLRILDEVRQSQRAAVVDCEHRGLAAARNTGATLARAQLIMFLDSDDLLDPGALEKLCWTIAKHPEFAFVYSGVVHFGNIDAVCYDEFDAARLQKENFLTATCVMRRDLYLELGGNDESMTETWEDYDFWLRLVDRGYIGKLFREPLFWYRRHATASSAQLVSSTGASIEAISKSVVTRHLNRGRNGLPPLTASPRDLKNHHDVLLGELEAALTATIPLSTNCSTRTIPPSQPAKHVLPSALEWGKSIDSLPRSEFRCWGCGGFRSPHHVLSAEGSVQHHYGRLRASRWPVVPRIQIYGRRDLFFRKNGSTPIGTRGLYPISDD